MADRGDQKGLHRQLQEGRQYEQAPNAVDDAGDAGQKLDGDAQRALEDGGAEFGDENGDAETDGHADDHGDERGNDGAVDRRQGAELVRHGIPNLGDKETEAEGAKRRPSADDQRDNDAAQQQQHHQREEQRAGTEEAVLQALTAALILGVHRQRIVEGDVGHDRIANLAGMDRLRRPTPSGYA